MIQSMCFLSGSVTERLIKNSGSVKFCYIVYVLLLEAICYCIGQNRGTPNMHIVTSNIQIYHGKIYDSFT